MWFLHTVADTPVLQDISWVCLLKVHVINNWLRWAGVSNEIAGCTWQCWQFPLLIFLYWGLWTLDFKQIRNIFPTIFLKFLQINFGRTVSIWKSRLLGWCMHAWVLGGVEGVYKLVSVSHLAVLCPSRGIAESECKGVIVIVLLDE